MFADNIEVEAAYEEDAEISQVRKGRKKKEKESKELIASMSLTSVVKS